MLRIAGINKESIVDGPGIRLVIYTQGCKHNCVGCHNPETHSFNGGELISIDEILKLIKENPLLDGITFSGGEPFEQAEELAELSKEVKKQGLNIITYTGYTFEEIMDKIDIKLGWKKLLYITDYLIDGKFDISRKSMELKFRGSLNQRIIDVKETLDTGKIVIEKI